MADTKRLYDERTKKPGEAVTYEIPWWLYLGHTWRPGERFVTTTYVRPSRPNGFEYECTTAGQTGAREPTWPTTVALTVTDGSVIWTCRAIGNNAVDTISGNGNWVGETGITVANPQTDAIKQLSSARVSAGTAGQTYFITCTIVTTGGDTYIFTLKLSVE